MRHFTNTLPSTKRRRHNTQPPRPPLLIHILNRSWQSAILRATTHPSDIKYQDGWGNTPLHIACRFDDVPVELVTCLSPISASMRNVDGCLPLHYACSHRCSSKVVRVLLLSSLSNTTEVAGDYTTKTTPRTRSGKNALHYACGSYRGCRMEGLKVLLEGMDHRAIFERDDGGRTPLDLLYERYAERVEGAMRGGDVLCPTDVLGEFWSKACCLLRAAYYGRYSDYHNIRREDNHVGTTTSAETVRDDCCVVHASVGVAGKLRFSYEIVCLALAVHPEQVKLRDDFGNLPIHIAARLFPNPYPHLIPSLIRLYPEGVKRADRQGKLPFVLALEKKDIWREDVKTLLKAFPAAIETLSSRMEQFFPHILELVGRKYNEIEGSGDCRLSVVYELVKAKPNVIGGAAAAIVKSC